MPSKAYLSLHLQKQWNYLERPFSQFFLDSNPRFLDSKPHESGFESESRPLLKKGVFGTQNLHIGYGQYLFKSL